MAVMRVKSSKAAKAEPVGCFSVGGLLAGGHLSPLPWPAGRACVTLLAFPVADFPWLLA